MKDATSEDAMVATDRARARRRLRPLASILVVALAFALPASADPADPERSDVERPGRLLSPDRLERRVGVELEAFSALDRLDRLGTAPVDRQVHRTLADDVERAVIREGRDRIADQLVDAWNLEARLGRVIGRSAADEPSAAGGDERARGWQIGLGLRRAVPRLEMQRSMPRGELRLTVGADGRAGLRFRGTRLERTELDAGYDGDGRFHVSCAIGF